MDLQMIKEIHEKYHSDSFSLPDIAQAYATAVVEIDDKILGFGLLRDITESIMILDLSLPLMTKEKVLTELVKESVMKSHHDILHSFVEKLTFENFLKKHYGYKTCKGSALCLEK